MFNEIIRALRDSKGLTGETVAKAVGLSESAYRNYERGVREPSFETLSKLADFYGVTTDYLLGREPPADPLAQLGLDLWEISDDEFIKRYRALPEDGRKLFLNIMRMLTENAVIDAEDDIPEGYGSITLGELEDMRAAEEAEKQDGGRFA